MRRTCWQLHCISRQPSCRCALHLLPVITSIPSGGAHRPGALLLRGLLRGRPRARRTPSSSGRSSFAILFCVGTPLSVRLRVGVRNDRPNGGGCAAHGDASPAPSVHSPPPRTTHEPRADGDGRPAPNSTSASRSRRRRPRNRESLVRAFVGPPRSAGAPHPPSGPSGRRPSGRSATTTHNPRPTTPKHEGQTNILCRMTVCPPCLGVT